MIEGKLKVGEIVYSAVNYLDGIVVGSSLDDLCYTYLAVSDDCVALLDEDDISKRDALSVLNLDSDMCRTKEEAVECQIESLRKMIASDMERISVAINLLKRSGQ